MSRKKEKMRKYRVEWKKGQPYIEHGEVVISGKKRQIKRIKWPSESKTKEHTSGFDSIKEALEKDIIHSARLFGDSIFSREKPNSWLMAKCINKTLRLARKLQKYNLV